MIYIIGTGAMGGGIAQALAKKGKKILVYNRNYAKAQSLAKLKNIRAEKDLKNLPLAQIIILAVKPQDMAPLAAQIKSYMSHSSLVVSVIAGWDVKALAQSLGHKKIIRIMPTLAFKVGQGVTVLKFSAACNTEDKRRLEKLLALFTEFFEITDEKLIDLGGVIYGSAKAFYFLLAESLEAAASKFGFEKKTAHLLAEKTFLGAALLQRGENYQQLMQKVATKKGVTEATLKVFAKKHFNKIVEEAVVAGLKRTKQLSHG